MPEVASPFAQDVSIFFSPMKAQIKYVMGKLTPESVDENYVQVAIGTSCLQNIKDFLSRRMIH